MRIKRIIYILLSLLLSLRVFAQSSDYIVIDSVMKSGVKLLTGSAKQNAQYVYLKDKNKRTRYSPEQLAEYGFKSGEIYESRNIHINGQEKCVFLERLVHGKNRLYYYTEKSTKVYFYDNESLGLVQIMKDDEEYKEKLSEVTQDQEWALSSIKVLRFNKNALSKFISIYNSDKKQPLPYPKFGLSYGQSRIQLSASKGARFNNISSVEYLPRYSQSLGLFADIPIKSGNFSFNPSFNYQAASFAGSSRINFLDTDVLVQLTSIITELQFRYTMPSFTWQPYLNGGMSYGYNHTNNTLIYVSKVSTTSPIGSTIEINEAYTESLISEHLIGYSLGIGISRNIDFRRVMSLELKHGNLLSQNNLLSRKNIDLVLSISF